VILLLLPGALPVPARAQEPAREAELEAIRGEIAELQARLDRLRDAEAGLAGELERTDVELELQERRLEEAEAARDLAAAAVAGRAEQVAGLEVRLETVRRELSRTLLALYRLGRQGYLRLLLSLRPGPRLLGALRQLRYLARRDAGALERYREARVRLAFERDELEGQRRALEGWVAHEASRRRALADARRRQSALLARAALETRDLADRAGMLQDKERKLAALVDLLYGRSGEVLEGQPIQEFRGALDWPARGAVRLGFGPRLDRRYRTQVPHNGLDIAAARGAEVRSIYPGKVLFAAPFQGYGPTIVVHHPGRVFSLYAGLGELRAQAGDVVSLGAVLGLAAETLYFEIRAENRPEDPLLWLR
jgi:septal ring factor EnvC (AmiA/AmiB activator)